MTAGLDAAACRYRQRATEGSDHQILMFALDLRATAGLVPPGPVPPRALP